MCILIIHNVEHLVSENTVAYQIEEAILRSNKTLDYIKIGIYNKDLGPLNIPSTNQKFYEINYHYDVGIGNWYELKDLTYMFQ